MSYGRHSVRSHAQWPATTPQCCRYEIWEVEEKAAHATWRESEGVSSTMRLQHDGGGAGEMVLPGRLCLTTSPERAGRR